MKTSARFALTLSTLSLLAGSATALAAPGADSEVVTKVVRFEESSAAALHPPTCVHAGRAPSMTPCGASAARY
jgi:hypothetical protein